MYDKRASFVFLKSDFDIFLREEIRDMDCSQIEDLIVVVTLQSGRKVTATNLNAIELVMQTKPSIIEGRRLKWARHRWILHNLIAHPVMQILAFFRCYRLAFWVHDVTVPCPKK